jgi:hypothetical protein
MHQSEGFEPQKMLFVDRFVQWSSPHDDPVLSTHHSRHRRAQTSHQVHDADPGPRLHCIRSILTKNEILVLKTYNKLRMRIHPPAFMLQASLSDDPRELTHTGCACSHPQQHIPLSTLAGAATVPAKDPCDVQLAPSTVQLALANHPPVTTLNTGPLLQHRELGRLSKSSRCLVRPAPCDTVVEGPSSFPGHGTRIKLQASPLIPKLRIPRCAAAR